MRDDENPCGAIDQDKYNDEELRLLAQGITVQRIFKKNHVYNVLKYACMVNETLRSRDIDIKESHSAANEKSNIISGYEMKDLTKLTKELNDKWNI